MGELARAVKHFQVREATARSLVRRLAEGWRVRVATHSMIPFWDRGEWQQETEPMTPAEAALYREFTAPDDGDRGDSG